MTLVDQVRTELQRGATGAADIAARIGADQGLVELAMARLRPRLPLVFGQTACSDGCAPSASGTCRACPLAGGAAEA